MNFFDSVVSFFETLMNMISQFFSSLITAVNFISTSVGFTTALSFYLPTFIGSCLIIVVALGILKFVLGR